MARIDQFWNLLGQETPLLFGKECASAAAWMFCCLVLRWILIVVRLDRLVPYGVIFAFPSIIKLLGLYVPLFTERCPLLAVRLAESIMGRLESTRLAVVVPAHFMGSVVGAIMFRSLRVPLGMQVLRPILYDEQQWVEGFVLEVTMAGLYCICYLVIPELLEINRKSVHLLSAVVLPVLLFRTPNLTSTLNPTAVYALWFLGDSNCNNNDIVAASAGSGIFSTTAAAIWNLFSTFPLEHLVGPIVGAAAAGYLCSRYFPDQPNCWRRK